MVNINVESDRSDPPGVVLGGMLEEMGWSQRDLAGVLGWAGSTVNDLVSGKIRVTPEVARLLAAAVGKPVEFWLDTEQRYRLSQPTDNSEVSEVERRRVLYGRWPISEMTSRKWIAPFDNVKALEEGLQDFIGDVSLDATDAQIADALQMTARRTHTEQAPLAELLAWRRRVEHRAAQISSGPFDAQRLSEELPDLLDMSQREETVAEVADWLARRGVRLVIERHLPKTKLDGAAFWLDGEPVIGLTLRYGRLDSFWFTLCHECGHIALNHKGTSFDDMTNRSKDAKEAAADRVAEEWLIPPVVYGQFRLRAGMRPRREHITSFATLIKRHPGIVLGRMQHDKSTKYSSHRELLPDIRRHLSEM